MTVLAVDDLELVALIAAVSTIRLGVDPISRVVIA
jgi:hypothetical protein